VSGSKPEILGVPRFAGPARGPLSAQTREAAERLIARYPQPRSALLPLLYLVQAEHGFVSREGMTEVASWLDLTTAEVAAVATFYTMFKRAPLGEYLVSVCTQPPCALAGAVRVVRALEKELGVQCGETTADGRVSLEEVECLCACDGAPVLQVNYEDYARLTEEQALELVRGLRAGDTPPLSARGATPAGSAQVHRELSGVHGARERRRP
jgi:NADH-quinone oxidoreductase subunit E